MIKRLFRFLRGLPPARALSKLSKRLKPWGFEGLTMYEVAIFFGRGINRGGLRERASSMAYNFFIALFPSIIFLFTLIPFIPIQGFQDELFILMKGALPQNASKEIVDTISEITYSQHSKLLSFGFIAALYFSTQGFNAMMVAFNKSIHVKEQRRAWKQQLIAVLLVLVLTTVIVTAVTILIGEQYFVDKVFHRDGLHSVLLFIGQWIIIGFLFLFIIAVFFRYGPSQRMHKHFISPGVIFATILIILTSLLFAWYINNFGKYNKLYGSIGSIIVVLIWIYYNSMMLVVGFELDAAIEGGQQNKLSLLEQEELEIMKETENM